MCGSLVFKFTDIHNVSRTLLPQASLILNCQQRSDIFSHIEQVLSVTLKETEVVQRVRRAFTSAQGSGVQKNANAKMSPSFRRLVSTFSWTDSFRALHPNQDVFSHYYSNNHQGVGATRIDRMYHCGQIKILRAEYIPIAFSDHMGLRIDVNVPSTFSHLKVPQSLPLFKANPDIVKSCRFK